MIPEGNPQRIRNKKAQGAATAPKAGDQEHLKPAPRDTLWMREGREPAFAANCRQTYIAPIRGAPGHGPAPRWSKQQTCRPTFRATRVREATQPYPQARPAFGRLPGHILHRHHGPVNVPVEQRNWERAKHLLPVSKTDERRPANAEGYNVTHVPVGFCATTQKPKRPRTCSC